MLHRTLWPVLLIVSLLPLAANAAVAVARPPRVGPNIQVNDPQPFPFGRSETTIAIGGNGKRVVVGWNDGEGFCGPPAGFCGPLGPPGFTGYGYSSDGGRSFTDGGAPPLGERIGFGPGPMGMSETGMYTTLSDPALAAGGTGNGDFYYANIAVFADQGPGIFIGFLDPSAGVSVHVGGFDGAGHFAWKDAVLLQSPNYPKDFLDKEFIAVDERGSVDHVHVSVTNFTEVDGEPMFGFGQIETYSSTDGFRTWERAIVQPDETISVPDNWGVVNQGSEPVVAPDGTVHVAWERGRFFPLTGSPVTPEIRVATSTDEGATWTPTASLPPSSGQLLSPGWLQPFHQQRFPAHRRGEKRASQGSPVHCVAGLPDRQRRHPGQDRRFRSSGHGHLLGLLR